MGVGSLSDVMADRAFSEIANEDEQLAAALLDRTIVSYSASVREEAGSCGRRR
jgi:hypothetical protein